MAYSDKMVNSVKTYLEESGHTSEFDEKNGFFILKEQLGGIEDEGLIFIQLVDDCVLFRCMTSMNVAKGKMNAVSEYINRVNDALINGCFVLDYDEGRVAFKTYTGCYDGDITDEQLADVFASCELAYEEFGAGLAAVAAGQIKDVKSMF